VPCQRTCRIQDRGKEGCLPLSRSRGRDSRGCLRAVIDKGRDKGKVRDKGAPISRTVKYHRRPPPTAATSPTEEEEEEEEARLCCPPEGRIAAITAVVTEATITAMAPPWAIAVATASFERNKSNPMATAGATAAATIQ
jgi:hypothetical protein